MAEDVTKESVMQWSIGDLSLIKGAYVNGVDDRKTGINQNRRVLKHMRYDHHSGNFVPSNQKKLNRMSVSLKVDQRNHTVLWEMFRGPSCRLRQQRQAPLGATSFVQNLECTTSDVQHLGCTTNEYTTP